MEELDLASTLARRATAALGGAYFFSALPHSYANAAGAKMLYRADSDHGVIPVHQEASAGMLLESVGSLAAMQRLGVHISRDEKEAWLHLWNVVGHLLGVSAKVLPNSLMEAQSLLLKIRERGECSSEEGQALAQALVKIKDLQALWDLDARSERCSDCCDSPPGRGLLRRYTGSSRGRSVTYPT